MPMRGDFSELAALRKRMQKIGDGTLRRDINKNCAEASIKVLDDEFRSGTDPYGKPWPALTSREGQPLRDTGTHLQNGLAAQATDTGFAVSTAFVGAGVHQYGAVIKPKNKKALAFKVRGAPTKSNKRGRLSKTIFARSVTIPQRQYMPEVQLGTRWTGALESAADRAFKDVMGGK